jgi:hypothetical protein
MTAAEPVWAASFSAGAGVGPHLGGVLLEHLWWGSVFLPALPRLADAGPISAQHRSWGAIPLLRKVSCHPTQTQPKQRSVL